MSITRETYAGRREACMANMGNGVAIFASSPEIAGKGDLRYAYRPDTDIVYLTGIRDPDVIVVLAPEGRTKRFILFIRRQSRQERLWDGKRLDEKDALELYGADLVYAAESFEKHFPGIADGAETLYYSLGKRPDFDARIIRIMESRWRNARAGETLPFKIAHTSLIIDPLRSKKSREEIAVMRTAYSHVAWGYMEVMRKVRPGMTEHDVASLIEYCFMKKGAQGTSFPTIAATGEHATTLHYVENRAAVRDGDLILLDSGMEFHDYCTDTTRTFPANGAFSRRQKQIYEIVLNAQEEAMRSVRPGATIGDVHDCALGMIIEGLLSIGLLKGTKKSVLKDASYRTFFMHKTSHWIGMDVRDPGQYKSGKHWKTLEPGMVFTVEPGIYVPRKRGVKESFQGIGVRIEDVVAVTRSGHEVLSSPVPRRIDDICGIMKQ